MITIPVNNIYLNYKMEVDNANPFSSEEYLLEFPHTHGSNRTYKSVYIEVFKSGSFEGSVTADFVVSVTDSLDNTYEKPALFQKVDDSAVIISTLDGNTTGIYKMLDMTSERLVITVTQVTQGNGRIVFNIRGI